MHRYRASFVARLMISLAVLVFVDTEALAQGVTGSAVTGTVRDPDGAPVPEATVQLRNPTTGDTYTATSDAAGTYFLDNVVPGGPYILTAAAPGYEPNTRERIQLSLGQRLKVDFPLRYFGEPVEIVSHADALDDHARTGPSTTVRDFTITRLPLLGRNFTSLTSTDPRVSGNSFAGQNNKFNNIQIDGGANNDLFGLADNGTPGGSAGATPLSIEAVKEFVVQIAPFDVRQGSFAGGLVNAITKSGTNDLHGTIFGYYQGKSLSNGNAFINGSYVPDPNFTDFTTGQYGLAVGGPILKDKAHFFIVTDLQSKSSSFGNPANITGLDAATDIGNAGFTVDIANKFANILSTKYGINNVGNAFAPSLSNPDRNLFIKVTSSQIENSNLELSYNYVNASSDVLARAPTSPSVPGRLRDGYQLSNDGYSIANTTNTARMKLTTNFDDGKMSNEFLGGVSYVRDARQIPTNAPLILVKAVCGPTSGPSDPTCSAPTGSGLTMGKIGSADAWLAAGGERFSQANALDQDVYQLQDNLTYSLGSHRLTFGTSNEFFRFRNLFLQASTGVWAFNSLDDLAAGNAVAFQRNIAVSDLQAPGTAKFQVAQLGFYVQDEYTVLKNLTLTPGMRIDVPYLSSAVRNPALVNNAAFPIDTSQIPSGNPLWSPRIGFNWDVDGSSDTIVRGGAGLFAGRPPYVWVSNAYLMNGLSQVALTCVGASGVPAFTPDPTKQPTTCPNSSAKVTNYGEIDYFASNTRYPQNLRVALGADRRLPWGLVGTFDFLYTADVNGWYITDENLQDAGADGEGRETYGAFTATTFTTGSNGFQISPTTARIDNNTIRQAVKVSNKNGGYVTSATFQLQKQFGQLYAVSVGYTYSRSYDRISFTSSQAFSNFQFEPIDGTIGNRNVRPSAFDRPHRIIVTGTANLPLPAEVGIFGVGLSYVGQSGTPYTWTVNGDVNGDGINGNDLPFIPADPSQILLKDPSQYPALAAFINSQSCLSDAKGSFLQRGACRNPWNDFLDLRLTWTSPDWKEQRIEVQWDIFNVLNLIHQDWGHYRQVTGFETAGAQFLQAVGYDPASKRPIYSFAAPSTIVSTVYDSTRSRWRMQLGARYTF